MYSLGGGLAQAPLGEISDRYDRIYILPTGILVAASSYLLFAAAPVIGQYVPGLLLFDYRFEGGFVGMVVAMLGVGLGAAVVHPTGYPLISTNISDENEGKAMGMFGSFAKLGDAIAPAVIGILVLVLVWEEIMVALGLVGIVYAFGLYLLLRGNDFETATLEPGSDDHQDVTDGTADTLLEQDNRLFLYPMIVIYFFFVIKMFAAIGLNTFVPVFIVGIYAYSFEVMGSSFTSESVANFYFAALLLSAAVSQLILGSVMDRFEPKSVIIGCLVFTMGGLLAFALFELSPLALLFVLIVIGASLWGTNPVRDTLISERTPPEREGRTFGYIWTAVHITVAFIPPIVGYTIEVGGFRRGFLVLLRARFWRWRR